MSATNTILICPKVDLQQVPPAEWDVIRRFLFQYIGGADADSDREWKRAWRDVRNAAPGECLGLRRIEGRDGPFHRRHRAILANLLNNVEGFANEDALHDWLKVKCWHVDWKDGKPVPASTSFDKCSEARMRKFNRKLTDLLHQPWVQRRFWPHIPPAQRHQMVEIVLRNPTEENQ